MSESQHRGEIITRLFDKYADSLYRYARYSLPADVDAMEPQFSRGFRHEWISVRLPRIRSSLAGLAAILLVAGLWAGASDYHRSLNNTKSLTTTHLKDIQQRNSHKANAVLLSGLTNIHMVTERMGWAEKAWGDTFLLLHTVNGGETWHDVTPTNLLSKHGVTTIGNSLLSTGVVTAYPDASRALFAIAIKRGTSVRDSESHDVLVLTTSDAGQTWRSSLISENLPSDQFGQNPVSFDFVSGTNGWLVTSVQDPGGETLKRGALYKTTNGGQTWTRVSVAFDPTGHPTMPNTVENPNIGWVSFVDPTTGFTLGSPLTFSDMPDLTKPMLYQTTDGGTTWTEVSVPSVPHPNGLTEVRVLPPQLGGSLVILPVVTETTHSNSNTLFVYVSRNKGLSFTRMPGHVSFGSNNLAMQYGFRDARHGWFWIGGMLFRTDDDARTISQVHMNQRFNIPGPPSIFSWPDPSIGFMTSSTSLWETRDGGRIWTRVQSVLVQ